MPTSNERATPQVIYRRAEPGDAEAAAQLAAQVFAGVSFDYLVEQRWGLLNGTTWRERKMWQVREEVEAEPHSAIVAEADGELIGFVTTRFESRSAVGRILNLAVAQEWQGQGIGKRLLAEAYRLLRDRGAKYLRIETLETNEVGKHLYPKLGFREVVRQIYYFMGVEEWQGPR